MEIFMKNTSIFDIVGPIMIGPSSSHTAGAVRLGLMARKIYNSELKKVVFTLYNSFAKTGKGHGTDKGLLGGIQGFEVDDTRIKEAHEYAQKAGIKYEFRYKDNPDRHPNAVDIEFLNGSEMSISGNSIGGGEIKITAINGFNVDLDGTLPTLLMVYKDKPGMISKVTGFIQEAQINIATLNCDREAKGETATMTICLDSVLPEDIVDKIKNLPDVYLVRNIDVLRK